MFSSLHITFAHTQHFEHVCAYSSFWAHLACGRSVGSLDKVCQKKRLATHFFSSDMHETLWRQISQEKWTRQKV